MREKLPERAKGIRQPRLLIRTGPDSQLVSSKADCYLSNGRLGFAHLFYRDLEKEQEHYIL